MLWCHFPETCQPSDQALTSTILPIVHQSFGAVTAEYRFSRLPRKAARQIFICHCITLNNHPIEILQCILFNSERHVRQQGYSTLAMDQVLITGLNALLDCKPRRPTLETQVRLSSAWHQNLIISLEKHFTVTCAGSEAISGTIRKHVKQHSKSGIAGVASCN